MMKKVKLVRYIVISALIYLTALTSCNYLDIDEYIYDKQTLDSVFLRQDLIKQYLNGGAEFLPDESRMFTESWSPFGLGADEAFASWEDGRHASMYLLLDHLLPTDGYFNNWNGYYKGIRKANNFLARQHECKDLTDSDRREFSGRAYFLLGYYYYLLLQQYGPVPIIKIAYDSDENSEVLSQERNSYNECVDYICQCMETAHEYLPYNRQLTQQFLPNKAAALAVISRVRLYAASPWYNGNTFYADWKTSDGRNYISQEKDNTQWGKSAVASQQIINMNQFALYTYPYLKDLSKDLPAGVTSDPNYYKQYPEGAGGLDHYVSCMSTFTGESFPVDNFELIYYCNGKTGDDSPAWIATPYQLGGSNGLNATQDMVDAFKMNDGSYYNKGNADRWEPANVTYSFGYGLFTILPSTPKMYMDREPRFYTTIGFNHRQWKGTSSTDNNHKKNVEVTYYSGSATGGPDPDHLANYNRTGYTCVKYIHPEDHQSAKNRMKAKIFPIFRYAEILLNYAEALNELEAPYTDQEKGITVSRDIEKIKEAVNRIRYRAGIPGLSSAELASRESIREAIKNERRVEFAFEGRRYHDLRRWGDAPTAYNKAITGMNVDIRESNRKEFYNEIYLNKEVITRRVFTNKMYFYPIPRWVLDRNGKLEQNPGW